MNERAGGPDSNSGDYVRVLCGRAFDIARLPRPTDESGNKPESELEFTPESLLEMLAHRAEVLSRFPEGTGCDGIIRLPVRSLPEDKAG